MNCNMADDSAHSDPGVPLLVAHRGYAALYPENTLPSCEAALRAGACFIEIDVQLSADGVPVLFHDHNLARTTGHDALITDVDYAFLQTLDAGERQRLGNDHPFTAIPTLAEFAVLLQQWPRTKAFVEIKEESLDIFGRQRVLQQILETLTPVRERCIAISYDADVLGEIQAQAGWRTGWVLHRYDDDSHEQARSLSPDYLICNYTKLDDDRLWPGPWQWMLYEVTEVELALQLYQRGAQLIETMTIATLLEDDILATAACRQGNDQ